MKRLRLLLLILFLAGTVGFMQQACAKNPPILSPSAAAALTNGLGALSTVLQAHGANPLILAAISDAQTAIAKDVSGSTWGEIVRQLLTDLYSQLPPSILNQTPVWASFAAIEVVLATIGA